MESKITGTESDSNWSEKVKSEYSLSVICSHDLSRSDNRNMYFIQNTNCMDFVSWFVWRNKKSKKTGLLFMKQETD